MSLDPNKDSPAQDAPDILRAYVGAVSPQEEVWYAQFRAHVVQREQFASADVAAGIDVICEATRGRQVRSHGASGHMIGESYPRTRGRTPWQSFAYIVTCAIVFFSLGIAAGRSGFPPHTLTERSTAAVTWLTYVIQPSMRDTPVHVAKQNSPQDTSMIRRMTHITIRVIGSVINVVKHSTAPYESEPESTPIRYSLHHIHPTLLSHTSS